MQLILIYGNPAGRPLIRRRTIMPKLVVTFTTTFIYGVDEPDVQTAIDKARVLYVEDLQAAGSEVALYNSTPAVRPAEEGTDDELLFD